MKRLILFLLSAALMLAMSACRTRTTTIPDIKPTATEAGLDGQTTAPDTTDIAENMPSSAAAPAYENPQPEQTESPEHDPSAERREYSPDADAELTPDAQTPLVKPVAAQPEAESAPAPDAAAADGGGIEAEEADKTATQSVPEEDAENTDAADDAPAAETQLNYYKTLLDDRLGSMFECEKLYIYWETSTDYTTVFKSSDEHQLILDAGAYNVSAKLMEDSLTVDDGWVCRKNPGMVVKVVSQDILGDSVTATAAAGAARDALLAREDWAGLDAAESGKILVVSELLLKTEERRTAAALYLAKAMYPALFADIDPGEALRQLAQEAGASANGIFVFGS